MKIASPDTWPQFYTATVKDHQSLFETNKHKDILVDSLRFLVNDKRIILNAFVIMSTHIHVIWQAVNPAGENTRPGQPIKKVQASFMKFTAQQIKFNLQKNHPETLELYKVNSHDRDYNFWKRRSLEIEIFTPEVFQQKLNYIHNNPVKAGLCNVPEEYYYSSAKFYHTGIDDFKMLTHYDG